MSSAVSTKENQTLQAPAACPPMTDLKFVEAGRPWPPPSQEARRLRYQQNTELWDGHHDLVFGNWWKVLREDEAASLELVFNWHKRLSCHWADLMLSEPPRFTDGADDEDPSEEDPTRPDPEGMDPKKSGQPFDPSKPAKNSATADETDEEEEVRDPKPGEEGYVAPTHDEREKEAEDKSKEETEAEQEQPNQFGHIPEGKPHPKAQEAAKKKAKQKNNPRQDAIDRLVGVDDNAYVNTLYEIALDISRYGNGLAKINLAEEGAEIWAQPPTYWFPVSYPHNLKKIKNHVLAWEFEVADADVNATPLRYLWIEIHHKGQIEYRTHRLLGNLIGEEVPITQFDEEAVNKEQTNLPDEFLVVPFSALQTSDRLFGVDDYRDLDSIIAAIEVRAAQINRVLDKHTDPSIAGPPDQLRRNPETQKMEFVSGGRYIEIEEGDVTPEYLTWDGALEAQFNELEFLLEQLYFISETTPAAFGQQKEGLAESGSALRRLMMAPLIKVARITKSFDPAARKVLKIAAKLEAANGRGTPPLDHIRVEWQDGLPGDPKEMAEAEQIRTGNKATSSQVSSIQRLNGGTIEEAQAEADRINEEGQQSAQTTLAQTEAEFALAAKHAPPGESPLPGKAPAGKSGVGAPSSAVKKPEPQRSSS